MKLTTEQTNDMKTTTTKCTKNHSGNHTMVWDSNTGVYECAGCGHIRLAREQEKTMSKTIRKLATCIIDQQASVYTNDDGQGSGGPGMVDPETLAELVESGEIDDYEIIDGEEADEIVAATLWAHRHDAADGTRWIVARRTDEGDCSPYRHYLLLWDTEQEDAY